MPSYDQQRRFQKQQQKRAVLVSQIQTLIETIADFCQDSSLSPYDHRFLTSLRAALQSLARVFKPLKEEKSR